MNANLKHKDILIMKAKEDLKAAMDLIKIDGSSEEIVLFHCQQAVEKALKAYLGSKNVAYPKTHDIESLLSLCVEKDAQFSSISYVTEMTPYAVEIRYDELIEASREEVAEQVR